MSFASFSFLAFIVVVFVLYWRLEQRSRLCLLLLANYAFYCWFDWHLLPVLLFATLLNYLCGARIACARTASRRRIWVFVSVVGSVGILGYFKYFHFFAESLAAVGEMVGIRLSPGVRAIALPLGISYYTFQLLSYTLDIHRGVIKPTTSLLVFATYASFFPHIVAGPITRARQLLPQLEKPRRFSLDDLQSGLVRFLLGFFKKAFIADTLALYLVDPVFAQPGRFAGGTMWLALFGYFVQVYADFSGYSSMAIGSARVLGLKLPENFAFPYLSKNIAEFWRRWHITLSRWLRDYLWWELIRNTPFGGSLLARLRWQASLFLIFLVCGLWHGAAWTFIAWGALHGAYMVTYEAWHRWREKTGNTGPEQRSGIWGSILAWLVTQAAVGFSWLLFRSGSLEVFFQCLGGLVQSGGSETISLPPLAWLAFAAFLVDHTAGMLLELRPDLQARIPAPVKALGCATMILFLYHAQPEQVSQFIYFQF